MSEAYPGTIKYADCPVCGKMFKRVKAKAGRKQ